MWGFPPPAPGRGLLRRQQAAGRGRGAEAGGQRQGAEAAGTGLGQRPRGRSGGQTPPARGPRHWTRGRCALTAGSVPRPSARGALGTITKQRAGLPLKRGRSRSGPGRGGVRGAGKGTAGAAGSGVRGLHAGVHVRGGEGAGEPEGGAGVLRALGGGGSWGSGAEAAARPGAPCASTKQAWAPEARFCHEGLTVPVGDGRQSRRLPGSGQRWEPQTTSSSNRSVRQPRPGHVSPGLVAVVSVPTPNPPPHSVRTQCPSRSPAAPLPRLCRPGLWVPIPACGCQEPSGCRLPGGVTGGAGCTPRGSSSGRCLISGGAGDSRRGPMQVERAVAVVSSFRVVSQPPESVVSGQDRKPPSRTGVRRGGRAGRGLASLCPNLRRPPPR